MLLTDYDLYINNHKVSEAYFNNIKIYPKSNEPIGGNPFDIYSWSQIQSFVQAGTISSIVPLGTRTLIDGKEYMAIDYTYAGLDTLVLLATEPILTSIQWATTNSSFINYYNSIARQKVRTYINNLSIKDVLCSRDIEYNSGSAGTYNETVKDTGGIPSLDEMQGAKTVTTCNSGTQFKYFADGNTDWLIEDGVWTRSKRKHSTRQYICGIGNLTTSGYTYQANTNNIAPMLFIG